MQSGAWLLLLLLLLPALWFLVPIVVAWARLLRERKATLEKEETLASPPVGDAATLGELAIAGDVGADVGGDLHDELPAGLLSTMPDDQERVSPLDAPTQPSANDVSGAPEAMREVVSGNTEDTTDTTDTTDAAGEEPKGGHEAPGNLDIPLD